MLRAEKKDRAAVRVTVELDPQSLRLKEVAGHRKATIALVVSGISRDRPVAARDETGFDIEVSDVVSDAWIGVSRERARAMAMRWR